jgi:peptidoglycan/LPS O-acetylase OafA/YrhL
VHQQVANAAVRDRNRRTGSSGRRTYLPGLDGLRALAVTAVVLYHLDLPYVRGGFLGVDVFFVLSGYLISSQLWARCSLGAVRLWAFWAARIRRLLPAVLLLLVGATAAMLAAGRDQLGVFAGDVGAAATYTSNWWYILHERSYFESVGRPPVLAHLWSLAVEEQFYLLWPLLIAGLLRHAPDLRRARLALCSASLALAVASAAVLGLGSALTATPQLGDPSRWYFGTDSHASGLLLGAALAFRRGGAGFGPLTPALRPAGWRPTIFGVLALASLGVLVVVVDQYDPLLYRVGFALVAVLATVVVAVASRPGPLEAALSGRLLRYVGRRSYGLYLWHWPVVAFTRPELDLPWTGLRVALLRVTLTVVLAELSYRLVEDPVRRRGWRRAWACPAPADPLPTPAEAPLTPGQALGPGGAGGVNGVDKVRLAMAQLLAGLSLTLVVPPHVEFPDLRAPLAAPRHGVPKPVPTLTPDQVTPRRDLTMTVYGDSVALGAQPALTRWVGSVINQAREGQHSWTTLAQVGQDARAGRIDSDVVLIHTGDNGLVPQEQLRAALDALGGVPAVRQVVLVTPKVPRSWEARAVESIAGVAPDYATVQVADWHSHAKGHPEWFAADGIHLGPAGGEAYARLVLSRVTVAPKAP